MPEHVNINDPEIHEPKGASSAAADQILVADGSGGTSWESSSSVINAADFTRENILTGSNTSNQNLTSADTVQQVSFGASVNASSDPVQLLSDGTLQVNESGLYIIDVHMHVGRPAGGAGISWVVMRSLLNASELDTPTIEKVSVDSLTKHRFIYFIDLSQNDLITFEFYVDSGGGATEGGLFTTNPAVSGWSTIPSAEVLVQRFIP